MLADPAEVAPLHERFHHSLRGSPVTLSDPSDRNTAL